MAKSGKEMLIEMAMEQVFKNLPPEVIDNIRDIGQTVAGFKAQLDWIEAQNKLLLDHITGPIPKISGGDRIVEFDNNPHFDAGGNLRIGANGGIPGTRSE